MKFRAELGLLLLSFPAYGSKLMSLNIGPTLQYTRFHQGCLPRQVGFMAGPAFDFTIQKRWRPTGYIGFRGLWDIEHICSCDGLIIDANEYQVNAQIGFNFETSNKKFSVIPFTGIDFIHLAHQIECNIIRHKYFQVNVPIGIELQHNPIPLFSWRLKALYDIDAWTRLKVSTPCLCDTNDCKIRLKRGHRVQVELPLEWHYRRDKRVGIELSWTPLFSWQKFNTDKCSTECDPCCPPLKTDPEALQIPVLKLWHLGSVIKFGISF